MARAETKFRDLNFDQSLYLLAATSFPILFYALYTLALGTRTRFSRIDRKPSRELRDSLPRSSKVGFEVACEIARGVTNARHRGIFIESGKSIFDGQPSIPNLEDSRRISLSPRNDSRPLSSRNYRPDSRSNPSVFPSGEKNAISHRVFFFLFFSYLDGNTDSFNGIANL